MTSHLLKKRVYDTCVNFGSPTTLLLFPWSSIFFFQEPLLSVLIQQFRFSLYSVPFCNILLSLYFSFSESNVSKKNWSLSFSHSFINDGLTCFLFFAKNCYYRLVSTYLLEKSLKLLTVAKKHFFKKQKNPADLAYLVIKSQNCHQQANVLIKTAEGHQLEKKYVLKTSLRRLLHRTNLFQNFISSI